MQKSSETEKKIINAATAVFMEKGKDGARMQEIADKAGINKALLHYYFRSKEKLFTNVFNLEIPKVITNIFDAIDETADFQDFLHIFINRYIDNVAPRKNLLRFIFWISEKAKIEIAAIFLKTFQKKGYDKNPIVIRVEKAIEENQIRPVDPVNFALSLIGMCVFPIVAGPIVGKIFQDVDTDNKQFLENRKKEIFDLLWNGVKNEEYSPGYSGINGRTS